MPANYRPGPQFKFRQLVEDQLFNVQELVFENAGSVKLSGQYLRIIAVTKGAATIANDGSGIVAELKSGDFCLVPACLKNVEIIAAANTAFLCVEAN